MTCPALNGAWSLKACCPCDPMNDLLVRQAALSDLDDLAPLFDLYRVFQGRPSDPPAARAFLQARFDHGESVVFIAAEGQAAIGFAQLFRATRRWHWRVCSY